MGCYKGGIKIMSGTKFKVRSYRFKQRTQKLLSKIQVITKKTQDQVVHASLIRYKKELDNKTEKKEANNEPVIN
jgi:hypothetical protein